MFYEGLPLSSSSLSLRELSSNCSQKDNTMPFCRRGARFCSLAIRCKHWRGVSPEPQQVLRVQQNARKRPTLRASKAPILLCFGLPVPLRSSLHLLLSPASLQGIQGSHLSNPFSLSTNAGGGGCSSSELSSSLLTRTGTRPGMGNGYRKVIHAPGRHTTHCCSITKMIALHR